MITKNKLEINYLIDVDFTLLELKGQNFQHC